MVVVPRPSPKRGFSLCRSFLPKTIFTTRTPGEPSVDQGRHYQVQASGFSVNIDIDHVAERKQMLTKLGVFWTSDSTILVFMAKIGRSRGKSAPWALSASSDLDFIATVIDAGPAKC